MAAAESGFKQYFNGDAARVLGLKIKRLDKKFDVEGYAAEVDRRIPGKELKDRVQVMTEGLRTRLPQDYPEAVGMLVASLDEALEVGQGMFNDGWYLMAVARFVEEYGLQHPKESLEALREITQRHTAEFAIRPFIEQHHSMTMKTVRQWAKHKSAHVRRAASEGTRPRLPWGRVLAMFVKDPQPVLAVLEMLRSDPSEYVRKSVANNLNDISKDHPDVVLATARRWLQESPTPETTWIVKHALRTLIKKGNQEALQIVGASGGEHIDVRKLKISPASVAIGGNVKIAFEIQNQDQQAHKLTVDYVVHHVRQNGKSIPKVFKLTKLSLAAGEKRAVEKLHSMKEVTTRRYYPGRHVVEIQVNGRILAKGAFKLTA